MIESEVHYFRSEFGEEHAQRYELFQETVGAAVGVAAADTSLIGSARTGFSLHPGKNFKAFNATRSDFDIVVVSANAFEELWSDYLGAFYARAGRRFNDEQFAVFRKFLTTDSLVPGDPQFSRWEKRLGPLRRTIESRFYFDSSIKFRVYRDWDAVSRYHVDGLRTLQNQLRG